MTQIYYWNNRQYVTVSDPDLAHILQVIKDLDGKSRRNITLNLHKEELTISMDETGKRILVKGRNNETRRLFGYKYYCIVRNYNLHAVYKNEEPDTYFSLDNGEGFEANEEKTLQKCAALYFITHLFKEATIHNLFSMKEYI